MNEASQEVAEVATKVNYTELQLRNFWAKIDVQGPDDCWLWQGCINAAWGYGCLSINHRHMLAHRMAWIVAHHGTPIPHGMLICHSCDVPACVNPVHLFIGTVADNNRDKDTKGRGTAKLDFAKAELIRSRYSRGGITMSELGREYGVTGSNIRYLIEHRIWKW